VYIKAQRIDNSIVVMDVYDGKDGLHLGETPFTLYLKRRARTHFAPLSLIARPSKDDCPTHWQIVEVSNWGETPEEAADARKKNEVLFKMKSDPNCP
jgi:hypothetical protein